MEREGVRRALARAEAADLVLWLDPLDAPAPPPEDLAATLGGRLLRVRTKADLAIPVADAPTGSELRLSVVTGEGVSALVARLAEAAREGLRPAEPAVIVRARQREAVETAVAALDRALAEPPLPAELFAEELRVAGDALGRVIGRIGVEDVLERLFSSFCIGK